MTNWSILKKTAKVAKVLSRRYAKFILMNYDGKNCRAEGKGTYSHDHKLPGQEVSH